MAGARPSRGARVVYREIDSDDSDYDYDDFTKVVLVDHLGDDDDSNDVDFRPNNSPIQEAAPAVVYPPLSPLQKELKKVCRLGDKALLKSFLSDHPNIDLDVKDVDGGTLLTEAATKTAQFSDIVEVLVEAGAGLSVCDMLGNSPLHNAVLYFPSTQKSVDMLLKNGADVAIKNNDGVLPENLAEDKDLKFVLKELRKAAGRKKSMSLSVSCYLNSPELRRKVYDQTLMEETFNQRIIIKHNNPITMNSPGLLKRKRKSDDLDDSNCGREKKRIRWCPLETSHHEVALCSSEEDEGSISQDAVSNVPDGIDSEEDIIIVHKDVKKTAGLVSSTEACPDNLLLTEDHFKVENFSQKDSNQITREDEDDKETASKDYNPLQTDDCSVEVKGTKDIQLTEGYSGSALNQLKKLYAEAAEKDTESLPPPRFHDKHGEREAGLKSPSNLQCDIDAKVQNEEFIEVSEDSESEHSPNTENNSSSEDSEEHNQVIIKCSQGFGFFVES